MLTTIPFLIYVIDKGFSGYMMVYSDTYENACDKYTKVHPEAEIRNCTML